MRISMASFSHIRAPASPPWAGSATAGAAAACATPLPLLGPPPPAAPRLAAERVCTPAAASGAGEAAALPATAALLPALGSAPAPAPPLTGVMATARDSGSPSAAAPSPAAAPPAAASPLAAACICVPAARFGAGEAAAPLAADKAAGEASPVFHGSVRGRASVVRALKRHGLHGRPEVQRGGGGGRVVAATATGLSSSRARRLALLLRVLVASTAQTLPLGRSATRCSSNAPSRHGARAASALPG